MKKKLNFKSKSNQRSRYRHKTEIYAVFGKSENFFCKIIKNILFENKKF